ncbi:MAG: SDR family NAD(P)-dependent oxidoreductase [Gammaproteobacteria bacterium]|nr:MAG: SDR family NAD(P)-dependent oxidoreductase [Gammaproteobacteria bacterium]
MGSSDRLAIVTGTSSGIGAALATALLADDWTVVGMARRDAGIEHPLYSHIAVDLGDIDGLKRVAVNDLRPLATDARWERVALVNNAAISGGKHGLEGTDPDELAHLLIVNTVSPIYLMGFIAGTVLPAVALRIVNISSGAAVRAFPGLGDYCTSKAALRMAGMVMAAEFESDKRPGGLRTNAAVFSYEPGVVDTPMQTASRSKSLEEFPWGQPFKDFKEQGLLEQPEDVIGEVTEFISGDGQDAFVERRFGG